MKVIQFIFNILSTIFIIIGFSVIIAFSFGYKPYVVISGSMEPEIPTASIAFINTNYEFNKIKKGDVIAFKNVGGTFIIHRVYDINNGLISTKGDANNTVDEFTITKENYIGKEILIIPYIGYLVVNFKTKYGLIFLLMFFIIISVISYEINKYVKKK